MLYSTRTTQTRKREVSHKMKTKQRRTKTNRTDEWKWEDKEKHMTKKECTLEAEVLASLDHGSTPFDIFQISIFHICNGNE